MSKRCYYEILGLSRGAGEQDLKSAYRKLAKDCHPDANGGDKDAERHEVEIRGEPVRLPLKEFELLEILLANAGRVLPRDTLIDRVWGTDYVGDTKTLDVHIKRLRTKVEDDPSTPSRIVTIRGLGYKYDTPR